MILLLSASAAGVAEGERRIEGGGDEAFLEVSREVPEFGGAYIVGHTDTLYIWLTNPTDAVRDRAKAALIDIRGSEFETSHVVAKSADFTFAQLHEWRAAASDVFTIDGVQMTDVDERINRFTIGLTNSEQEERVKGFLSEVNVPAAAVNIEHQEPIYAIPPITRNRGLEAAAILGLFVATGLVLWRRRRRLSVLTS